MKIFLLQFLCLMSIICSFSTALAQSDRSGQLPSIDIDPKIISVEDLGADFHTASGTITVTAKIKNTSRAHIKGYATIYLLSAEGQEVYSYEEVVNNGKSFPHGSIIDFEASSSVSDISKVSSISVDFTQK